MIAISLDNTQATGTIPENSITAVMEFACTGTATITYRRAKNLPDAAIILEGTSSLPSGNWTAATILNESLTAKTDHDVVEAQIQLPPGDRNFLRLRATLD